MQGTQGSQGSACQATREVKEQCLRLVGNCGNYNFPACAQGPFLFKASRAVNDTCLAETAWGQALEKEL